MTTPSDRKKERKSHAEHWMVLAGATSFSIATILEAAQLRVIGITIHSALVGYQGLPLLEKRALVNDQLFKPNLIVFWAGTFEVRLF